NWWIAAAFVLQALIFGAAHANYPAQPFYARLGELIIPSFTFGGIYLAFGLLPAIISHFIYDVIWFALPIFVSTAPGIMISKIAVLFFASMPLLIIFYARIRSKQCTMLSAHYLISSWKPSFQEYATNTVP